MATIPPKPKFKLPAELCILGQPFTIHNKKLPEAEYGACETVDCEIYVDLSKHKSQDHVNRTLLHEAIHAILYVSGQSALIHYPQEDSRGNTGDMEEGLVTALEHGISQLYKINLT